MKLDPPRICIFCGSSTGRRPIYADAASRLVEAIAERGYDLVYGGGDVGLMGVVARRALELGRSVTGVIPETLTEREIAMDEVTDLRVVGSMHERKALMNELSGGFIALPGGFGTLEEIFEVTTWAQLGIHVKPAGFLEVDGFFERLVGFLDHAHDEGFIRRRFREMLLYAEDPTDLLDLLEGWSPPAPIAWLDVGES